MENNRKILTIIIILIAIIIIVIMGVMILGGNETNTTNISNELEDQTPSGNVKVDEQIIEGVTIEQSDISYSGNMSKLTTKVVNDSVPKTNFRFSIYFLNYEGDTIAEALGYVGDLSAGEVRYIEASVTQNVSEIADVRYEVIK